MKSRDNLENPTEVFEIGLSSLKVKKIQKT